MTEERERIVQAKKAGIGIDVIMELYHSLIGQEGCTWSIDYPDLGIISKDYEAGNLYCLVGEQGEVMAAVSVCDDPDVDNLTCWSEECLPAADAMRVAVGSSYQNRGIARKLLLFAMEVLRERGYVGIHFLVSKTNARALASYGKLNFACVGDVQMFDEDWWCYEKKL